MTECKAASTPWWWSVHWTKGSKAGLAFHQLNGKMAGVPSDTVNVTVVIY